MAVTASTIRSKTELMKMLQKENKEGVVFKHSSAPYQPGRPASGGDALKLKFHETASFIVTKVNAKRSVMLVLFNGTKSSTPAMSPSRPTTPCRHPARWSRRATSTRSRRAAASTSRFTSAFAMMCLPSTARPRSSNTNPQEPPKLAADTPHPASSLCAFIGAWAGCVPPNERNPFP